MNCYELQNCFVQDSDESIINYNSTNTYCHVYHFCTSLLCCLLLHLMQFPVGGMYGDHN